MKRSLTKVSFYVFEVIRNPYWHLAEREGSSNVPVNEWKSQYAARMEQLGLTDHRETAEELINAMLDRQCDCTE